MSIRVICQLFRKSLLASSFALLALSAAPLVAQQPPKSAAIEGTSDVATSKYLPPEAPTSGILDTVELLDDARQDKIAEVIKRLHKTHRVSLYLATFESLNNQELPANRADTLLKAWIDEEQLGAVLVFIVDAKRFAIAITPKLSLQDRKHLLSALPKEYESLVNRRPSIAAAVREALYNLDYSIRSFLDTNQKRNRFLRPIIYSAISLAAVLILTLVTLLLREVALHNFFGSKLVFPPVTKQERLGGRNTGGHSVTLNYTRPQQPAKVNQPETVADKLSDSSSTATTASAAMPHDSQP